MLANFTHNLYLPRLCVGKYLEPTASIHGFVLHFVPRCYQRVLGALRVLFLPLSLPPFH